MPPKRKRVPFGQEEISNFFPKRQRQEEWEQLDDEVEGAEGSNARRKPAPAARAKEPAHPEDVVPNLLLQGPGADDVLIGDREELESGAHVVHFRTRLQFEHHFGWKPTHADEDTTCTIYRDDRNHITEFRDRDQHSDDYSEDEEIDFDANDDSDVAESSRENKRHFRKLPNLEKGTYRSKAVHFEDIPKNDPYSDWSKDKKDRQAKFERRVGRKELSGNSFSERGKTGLLEGEDGEYDTPAGKRRRSKDFVHKLQAGEKNPDVLIRTGEGTFLGVYLPLYEGTKDIRSLPALLDKYGRQNVWLKDIKFKYKTVDVYSATGKFPVERAFDEFAGLSAPSYGASSSVSGPARQRNQPAQPIASNSDRPITISPDPEPRAPRVPVRRLGGASRQGAGPAGRPPLEGRQTAENTIVLDDSDDAVPAAPVRARNRGDGTMARPIELDILSRDRRSSPRNVIELD